MHLKIQLLKSISLWLEKEKNEKGKILSLKCKACIKFESKINNMSTFKETLIDAYSGGRLASLKDHCNAKPHMKVLRSFKASVLKMPAEVGQKESDTSVSPDELKRPKRKANIAYFVAKNDISFRKFPNLVNLVTREGNLNFAKGTGSLYVNKDGCQEFISAPGEVSVMNVAEVVSKLNFFSILIDWSTIHGKEKSIYNQSFQREGFIKRVIRLLLNY